MDTTAATSSPRRSSGTPTAAASSIRSSEYKAFSTDTESLCVRTLAAVRLRYHLAGRTIFSPPRIITSFTVQAYVLCSCKNWSSSRLSLMKRKFSSSRYPRSPVLNQPSVVMTLFVASITVYGYECHGRRHQSRTWITPVAFHDIRSSPNWQISFAGAEK